MSLKIGYMVYHVIAGHLYMHSLIGGEIWEVGSACITLDTRNGQLEPGIFSCEDYVEDDAWRHYAECTEDGCRFL